MYDIQLSERNIVIEKSKHLSLIGVFVGLQQNYSQTNAPRVQAVYTPQYNLVPV